MNYDYEYILESLGGMAIGILIFIILFALAIAIFGVICTWKMYQKMGKPGWASIIPVYSYWVLIDTVELNWWWLLIKLAASITQILGLSQLNGIASLVSLFGGVIINYNLAKKFKKDTGFVVLLTLLPIIGYAILAFSKDCIFDSSIQVGKNGFLGNNDNSNNTTNSNVNNTQYNNYQPYVAPVNNPISLEENKDEITESATNDDTQKEENEFVFCTNCGTKINKDTKFCPNCGKQNN